MDNMDNQPHETPIKRSLFDITSDMLELQEMLERTGGDITNEEIEARYNELFNVQQHDLPEKVEAYLALITENEGRKNMLMNEADRINELAATHHRVAKELKSRLIEQMQRMGLTKVVTKTHEVALTRTGGVKPIKFSGDVEAADLPRDLKKRFATPAVSFKWNRTALIEALEAGETFSFAELQERGFHLRIK